MPALTFYGGLGEIGGNKILLEDKGTRILLDFGKSFSKRAKFYDWTERPRQANGIGDFFALGLLPRVQGIYRRDLLKLAKLPAEEDLFVHSAVLSHAHSDHADYLSFLREDIPIYMGATTLDIISALEEEKTSNLEFEITSYKERPADRKAPPIKRKISTFRTGDKIKVDSIELEPIHVDHSLPGCYGFVIRTSSSTIAYTGDVRMHGNRADLTSDFIEHAKAAKPDILMCEGTRINESATQKETDVYRTCLEYVTRAKNGFVFADYSYKDLDRFMTFYNIAKKTARKVVINGKTARYLDALSKNDTLNVPKINDEAIVVYKPRYRSGSYSESDYDKMDTEVFAKGANVWVSDDIRNNQSGVIMTLGSNQVEELIDIRPTSGVYLHSSSEPFNEEGAIDEERMNNWVSLFGLARLHAHCSGHAPASDLNHIVTEIGPKSLIPIHTEHPELFVTFHPNRVKLAKPNEPLAV